MAAAESSSVPDANVLPDAPSSTVSHTAALSTAQARGGRTAPKHAKFIAADENAQTITAGDKVVIAVRQLVSPLSLGGEIISAGYTHLTNGAPNYGTDGNAFAQRFGASVARGSSQEIFSDGVFAPILHIDPRYYVEGSNFSFVHRAFYAATRVLVARTDGGRNTVNAPLVLGYAASAALNNAYYPQINRNFKDTASGFGGSLGGAAIGFVFSEFAGRFVKAVHMSSY